MSEDEVSLTDFVEEARIHIEQAEKGLLDMEQGQYEAETINSVFRAVHSIKGTAGYFELHKVVKLSHSMENLLGELREKRMTITPEMVDMLLSATDVLREMVIQPASSEATDIEFHVNGIKTFMPGQKAESKQDVVEDAWDMLDSLFNVKQPVIPALPAKEEIALAPVIIPAEKTKIQENTGNQVAEDSIRVSVGLLNDLLNVASEMVLGRNRLLRIVEKVGKENHDLEMVAQNINMITTRLQEKVMKARMQPLANVFNKFPRIVRELSRKMGKEVELVLEGATVELDKSIIEALTDPLTHLVRNSMDHGIESAQVRKAAQKPFTANITLKAYHEGGKVIVDVTDDGKGLDVERIKKKAIEKGFANHAEVQTMNGRDILAFIFRPGFSTAEQVSDISGRGVGMDVVKTNIEKIGGKIEIISEMGIGTTLRLILPLTLAIISSLIIRVNDDFFAVPQANLKGCVLIQPEEENNEKIEFVHQHPVLRLRNQLVPIVRLADILALSSESQETNSYFMDTQRTFRILIIKTGSRVFGLAVDGVCDYEEILVKPMPHGLKTCQCFSGVTILGDGKIAMILDTENVRVMAKVGMLEEKIARLHTEGNVKVGINEEQQVLLFRGSGSELLGLDINMVSRVEEIDAASITVIGKYEYIQFRGQSLRVIRPEHFLPINSSPNQLSKLYIVIPKLVKHPMGIIAHEVFDTVKETVRIDTNGVSGKGVLGSTILKSKIIILINIYELFEQAAPEYYTKEKIVKEKIGQAKTTVLLAEDTPFFAKMARGYLEWAGYEVLMAQNGQEALDILENNKVDIVVSDIEMPIMTGLELVRNIRASAQLKDLPVIALTSLTRDDQKEIGLRAGFDRYEQKLDRTILLESVAAMLSTTNS